MGYLNVLKSFQPPYERALTLPIHYFWFAISFSLSFTLVHGSANCNIFKAQREYIIVFDSCTAAHSSLSFDIQPSWRQVGVRCVVLWTWCFSRVYVCVKHFKFSSLILWTKTTNAPRGSEFNCDTSLSYNFMSDSSQCKSK